MSRNTARRKSSASWMACCRLRRIASALSRMAAMRFCSGRGGRGISNPAKFPREILCLVVPVTCRSIWFLKRSEFIRCISHLLSILSESGRTIQISTTVTHLPISSGKIHARPIGSGIRATKISPACRYEHFSSSALLEVIYRFDLLTNSPTPMSASWISLTSPSGS
ncbi:hypothetical protein D3C80_1549720 [compost metagenome]